MRLRSTTDVALTTPPTRRYISPTKTADAHDMYESSGRGCTNGWKDRGAKEWMDRRMNGRDRDSVCPELSSVSPDVYSFV